jgi:hypothetical protein
MCKKIISSLLISTIITQIVGCYSYQEITKDEFMQADEYLDLQVITKNQHIYEFDEGKYIVKEDSISGTGKSVNRKYTKAVIKDFTGSIYLGDVESLKFDRFNTLITIIGIAALAGIIILILTNIEPSLGSGGSGSGSSL